MRKIDLYNPTPFVEALIAYKGIACQIHEEPCPAFQDTSNPIIFDEGRWIMGVHPILGYLDRRVLWPAYFPLDHDEYAKASMVFDMFLREDPSPEDWLPIISGNGFVLGREPCVVDLILSRMEFDHPAWGAYRARVQSIQGDEAAA